MSKENLIKISLFIGVLFSISVCYYVMIVLEDYEIFFNEDGLPTLEKDE